MPVVYIVCIFYTVGQGETVTEEDKHGTPGEGQETQRPEKVREKGKLQC